jgi:hypothetical protein
MDADRRARVWGVIAEAVADTSGGPILRRFCSACAEALSLDGVVLALRTADLTPVLAHATGPLGRQLWDLQTTLGEGPATDAVTAGEAVISNDLGHTTALRRWPVFAPAAAGTGIRTVAAIPLQVGMVRLGILEMARERPGGFAEHELADAFTFAEFGLNLAINLRADPELSEPVPDDIFGMNTEVHQATGMIAAQLDTTADRALLRMRAHAFAHDLRLGDVALAVVSRKLRFFPDETDKAPEQRGGTGG